MKKPKSVASLIVENHRRELESLRDQFANSALNGMLSTGFPMKERMPEFCEAAYDWADHMLNARDKRSKQPLRGLFPPEVIREIDKIIEKRPEPKAKREKK